MFKKLQDWLFKEDYEELDIEDRDEYLEEEIYEEKHHKNETKVKESILKEEQLTYSKPSSSKINIDIKADEPVYKEEKETVSSVAPSKSRMTLTRKDDYEMPPVISPYFGIKGEDNAEDNPSLKLNAMNSAASKKETFNSVISPFYGRKKSQKPIQQTIAKHEKANQSSIPFITADDVDTIDEEDVNMSLDEIVSSNDVNTDDLIQFSLFGEDKKLQKEDFDNENAEENDEELPF